MIHSCGRTYNLALKLYASRSIRPDTLWGCFFRAGFSPVVFRSFYILYFFCISNEINTVKNKIAKEMRQSIIFIEYYVVLNLTLQHKLTLNPFEN